MCAFVWLHLSVKMLVGEFVNASEWVFASVGDYVNAPECKEYVNVCV